jgi:two-component system, OmpR family, sensor histidine kinase CpxA
MKVSYPLSLKVSLWLMLNLLLLAAVGIGLLVVRGGMGWDALVAGPSGDRMQSLANIIAGEVSAASSDARSAVLKRFGEAYKAEFYLFTFDEIQVAGNTVELPLEVRPRMEFRAGPGGFRPGGFGPRGSSRRRSDFDPARRSDAGAKAPPPEGAEMGAGEAGNQPPAEPVDKSSRSPGEKGRGGPDTGRRDPPPFKMQVGEPPSARFVVRAGTPAAYWVGMRVPFISGERGFPTPARLVARVGSMWSLLHLLNLQSWVLAGTAVLLLSVLFWLPLIRGITRAVGQLTTATERIAEGRFDTRVKTQRRDELGKLGESVNRMATRLDAHMNGQKRFLGDVAHELCSPLARLQMATGILADQAPNTLQETVADVRDEVQQMSTLVNELLAFTKAGLRPREVVCQPVDLGRLTRDVLNREDAAGRVTLTIADGMRVMAEPDLLSRALANLVRNAIRYAGEAGPIILMAAVENRQAVIVIEDNGPGVPAADLDRLGEPFFRPELARTRETGGVGLGLAIVRNSIAGCGGELRFANRTPRGFRAEIRLPVAA